MEPVPPSQAILMVPVDSLLNLPIDACYSTKSGQAGATVKREGRTAVFVASCDSLERQVEIFETLYLQQKKESEAYQQQLTEQTSLKRSSNSIRNVLESFIVGLVAGIVITILIVKRYGRK
jgi:hypothetical protein